MFLYEFVLLPEVIRLVVASANLTLSIAAVFFAFKVAALVQGGKMEKVWGFLAASVGVFALLPIYELLEAAKVVNIPGFTDLAASVLIILLVTAFYKAREILVKDVLK